MLEHTFVHLNGLTEKDERQLWQSGIRCWNDYLSAHASMPTHKHHCSRIASSRYALQVSDAAFFASCLPIKETWRAFPDFEKVAYLDIETTGLGVNDYATVIGVYDGNRVSSYIHGQNLDDFLTDIAKFDLMVTFNGQRFDVPFIRKYFASKVQFPPLHIDLMYTFHSLGHWGGLKAIEKRLGIARDEDLEGMNGYDAVKLWQKYKKSNDTDSLAKLIRYNAADITNLKPLMEWAYKGMRTKIGFES